MPQLYLYRCSNCHKEIEITAKLAGTSQDCPFCDQPNSFPGMRQIRKLPLKKADDIAAATAVANETRSWLFSGGLLVAVVAGLLGLALFNYSNSIATESKVSQMIEFGNSQIKELPSGLLWDAWDQMTQNGMPDWSETGENRYNKQAAYLSYIAFGLFAISAIGLIAMVISVLVRR